MFHPHGEFDASIENQFLILDVEGPWNLELIQKYGKDIQPLVEQLEANGPWACIVITRENCIFTPEAMDLLRDVSRNHVLHNKRKATAYVVVPKTNGYVFINDIVKSIYASSQPVDVFESYEDARIWLEDVCPALIKDG